jgi:N-sulfoglucosamine sulfohydrolase
VSPPFVSRILGTLAAALALLGAHACAPGEPARRPNILLVTTDDQSWLHAGSYGSRVRTPALDRLAREGVRFTHAFAASPSCTASRNTIFTGQPIGRLGAGATLFGTLPVELPTFTDALERAGYVLGFTGKPWGPGQWNAGGHARHPAGNEFNEIRLPPGVPSVAHVAYADNFERFLAETGDRPFFFWVGVREPHRPFGPGVGARAGLRPEQLRLPAFLPDRPEVRNDLADYLAEIEHADRQLERILDHLRGEGRLEDTLVVVTSDNGMPFPRAKANLYDAGTRVPLVVAGPGLPTKGRVVDDLVSLTDLAPTFLELAGVPALPDATGRSLWPLLVADGDGRIDPARDAVFFGAERHTLCRDGDVGYPARAIRTHRYAYIRNYEPDRWPAGDPDFFGIHFGDADAGPTKQLMLADREEPDVAPLFALAFGKRPAEELYDLDADPAQLQNLAGSPETEALRADLSARLTAHLTETGDPRAHGGSMGDDAPYYWHHPRDRTQGARSR